MLKGKAFAFAILPFVIESIFKVILVNDSSPYHKHFYPVQKSAQERITDGQFLRDINQYDRSGIRNI